MLKGEFKAKSLGLEALCRAQQTETPEAAIRGACIYLLKACGITQPPVPLKPLLSSLNVSFSWSKSGTHWKPGHGTASLKPVNGRLTIFLHEKLAEQNWRRSRFSVAHELMHALIIQMLGDAKLIATLDDTEEAYVELERVCNVGAAELLMPSAMIRKAVKEFGFSPKGLLTFYDRFLVSREALLWRIASVMPHASITRWRRYARKPSEETCYRVKTCYPPYVRGNERPWLPEGATTKHLSSDVVERVARQRIPEEVDDLRIELGDRIWKCGAVATFFDERKDTDQPQFEGFSVPDETSQPWAGDVLVFATKKMQVSAQVTPNRR